MPRQSALTGTFSAGLSQGGPTAPAADSFACEREIVRSMHVRRARTAARFQGVVIGDPGSGRRRAG